MNKNILKLSAVVALAGVSVLGLSACTSNTNDVSPSPSVSETASTATPSASTSMLPPVMKNISELNGTTVSVKAGNTIVVDTPESELTDWTAEIQNPDVASFTSGGTSDGATFNPGFETKKAGMSKVTMTNSKTGAIITFDIIAE